MEDSYEVPASSYDLFTTAYAANQKRAVRAAAEVMDPSAGPVLDIGAGTGSPGLMLLEMLPTAVVLAVEPSAAMRAVFLSKLAGRPDVHSRVTVYPATFERTPLPERLGGVLALGVLNHFAGSARRSLLAELAARLPTGTGVLADLQPPQEAVDVPDTRFASITVGRLTYDLHGSATHVGDDLLTWHMRYRTREGDTVLEQQETTFDTHHVDTDTLAREAADHGLTATRLNEPHILLTR